MPYPTFPYPTTQQTCWVAWVNGGYVQVPNGQPFVVVTQDTGTGSYFGNGVWDTWTTNYTTSVVYPQLTVWAGWNNPNAYISAFAYDRPLTKERAYSTALNDRPLTRLRNLEIEQEKHRKECETRRRVIIQSNRTRARQLRTKQAEVRADILLREHLDEKQLAEWTKDKAFHVETADGKRKYRIAYGLAGNIRVVECDNDAPMTRQGKLRKDARLCVHVYHPEGKVPHADNVLAQKLMLESAEEEFLAMANASYY